MFIPYTFEINSNPTLENGCSETEVAFARAYIGRLTDEGWCRDNGLPSLNPDVLVVRELALKEFRKELSQGDLADSLMFF